MLATEYSLYVQFFTPIINTIVNISSEFNSATLHAHTHADTLAWFSQQCP